MGLSTSSQVVMQGGAVPAFLLDLLVVGLSTGLVGSSILDRLRGADDDESSDDDPLLDDDAFGGEGLGDEFDEFGDDDEWGDDPFGGMDEDGDENTAELENRLGELETEVATLSSTVGTVRGENEHISETVEEVEADVRQLLDIYEMVTRGINPFVDDAGGLGGDMDGGSFGLFDDDSDEEEEELDPDVAGADAAGFFDEELVEPSDEDPFSAEANGDDDTTEDDAMETDDSTSGKSFEELKAEYDAGDADWAEDGSPAEDVDDWSDDAGFETDIDDLDGAGEDPDFETTTETFEESEPEFDAESADEFGDEFAPNGHADTPVDAAASPQETATHGRATTGNGFQFLADDDVVEGPQRPYLEALPGGYVSDLLVMEWLDFLVGESSVTDAARAVNYYHRIGWVAAPLVADLHEFLTGFGPIDLNRVNDPGCDQLTPEHHQRSLKYVMQLSGSTAESLVVDRWDSLSGVGRGL
jgi:archaellum component FlaD/FlaE/archaellum component FlaC